MCTWHVPDESPSPFPEMMRASATKLEPALTTTRGRSGGWHSPSRPRPLRSGPAWPQGLGASEQSSHRAGVFVPQASIYTLPSTPSLLKKEFN